MPKSSQNNKRIVKNTLFLSGRMFITVFVGIYSSRILLANLGVSDYGVQNVVTGFVSMFSVLNVSLVNAVQRFITFEIGKNNEENVIKVFQTSLYIFGIIALAFVCLGETVGLWWINNKLVFPSERSFAVNIIYQLSIVSTIINLVSVPFDALIIAHERMDVFAYVNVVRSLLMLAFAYMITWFGIDRLIMYAILTCVMYVSIRIFYTWFCSTRFGMHTAYRYDKNYAKSMFSFAGWSLLDSLSYMSYTQGVLLLINVFFGPLVNAAQSLAHQMYGSLLQFSNSIVTAAKPQFVKLYANGNMNDMQKLFIMVSKMAALIMLFVLVPIFLKMDFILHLWLKEVPDFTSNFARIYLLVAYYTTIGSVSQSSIFATAKIRNFIIINSIVFLLIFPVSYICLKFGMSPLSVYYTLLIVTILALIVRGYILQSLLEVQISTYYIQIILRPTVTVIISLFLTRLLTSMFPDTIPYLILTLLIAVVVSSLACFLILFEKTETRQILFYTKKRIRNIS